MRDRTIRFCYRKIIDVDVKNQWEKYVWQDTYKDLMMQLQMYNADKEGTYKRKDKTTGIFASVIDEQMEVHYRLLQSRDGLVCGEKASLNLKLFLPVPF